MWKFHGGLVFFPTEIVNLFRLINVNRKKILNCPIQVQFSCELFTVCNLFDVVHQGFIENRWHIPRMSPYSLSLNILNNRAYLYCWMTFHIKDD